MEISFKKSETKKFWDESGLPDRTKHFALTCAEKIFAVFNHKNHYVRHNGIRYYLSGKFESKYFNPAESIIYNINEIAKISTFQKDPEFKAVTLGGDQKIIHPKDINRIEYIFSTNNVFETENKSVDDCLIQFFWLLLESIKFGSRRFRFNFEQNFLFAKILCVCLNGGFAKSQTKVRWLKLYAN